MKGTLIVAFTLLGTFAALAQGTVIFSNYAPSSGLRAPVYGPEPYWSIKQGNTAEGLPPGTQVYNGALLSGSGWWAQLFAANGANQPESNLQPVPWITTFRTGVGAGYLAGYNAVSLPNVPEDAPVATLQLRVWDNSSGLYPTWNDALKGLDERKICLGESLRFNVSNIGGDLNMPALLVGLESFNLFYAIPESSVTALLLSGVAAGHFWRRKRRNLR